MYYESRSHMSHPVSGPEEAVRLIHNGELSSNRVPIWTNASKDRIALVPDGNINDPSSRSPSSISTRASSWNPSPSAG